MKFLVVVTPPSIYQKCLSQPGAPIALCVIIFDVNQTIVIK